ncbi:Putative Flagellin, Flp1-like, domain [Lachnospiraceae bacterium NE2001]|nr:Putative Flagellin, Flp1-like, domain [Lachnospiraceae bacterium NE2001]
MKEIYDRFRCRCIVLGKDNSGVAAVEIILILVVLIGLVIIFKTQAVSLVTKIWNTITENASTVTG